MSQETCNGIETFMNYALFISCHFQVDYDSDVVLRARKVFRDNDVYLNFEKMKVKIKIGKANLHFSNLFGGDSVLGEPISFCFLFTDFLSFRFHQKYL